MDALKGIAIIIVIANHAAVANLWETLPIYYQPLAINLTTSGPLAVAVFLLVSGFLWSQNAAVNHGFQVIKKKYKQIYPCFLITTISYTCLLVAKNFHWLFVSCTIVAVTLLIWGGQKLIRFLQSKTTKNLSKMIFYFLLALQILILLIYFLATTFTSVILADLDGLQRVLVSLIANLALAIPYGTGGIEWLDISYWYVALDFLIVWLIPILIFPVINKIKTKEFKIKILFMLILIPVIFTVFIMFKKILNLKILNIYVSYSFAVGIFLGYLFQKYQSEIKKFQEKYSGNFTLIISLIIIFFPRLIIYIFQLNYELSIMIWSLALAAVVIIGLNDKSKLAGLLNQAFLIRLGEITLPIFLVHNIFIRMLNQNGNVTNFFDYFVRLTVTISASYLFAKTYQFLFEKSSKRLNFKKRLINK